MATAPSPPILIWQPGGGIPVGPVSNPPVYSQAGITQLVAGQSYIDVMFGSVQTDDQWVLVECIVVNEIDVAPLNIWPGIITDKAAAGFRLQLNGMPDSSNYYLHWAVSGVNITPTPATSYLLTGPSSGGISVASTFTVTLPPSSTGTATVIPSDSGGGGAFSPTSVVLSTGTPSTTFTYTPGSPGTKTISVTNTGGLLNPASITFTVLVATGYSMTGPSTGDSGVDSTPFTVTLTPLGYGVAAPVTITLSDGGGGGTFTPASVILSAFIASATFTYKPASSGTKTISATNSGGLANPGSLSYVATVPFDPTTIAGLQLWLKADSLALSDDAAVSAWADSSSNANNATQSGAARPTFKTNIVNGKPVVRFVSFNSQLMTLTTPISSTAPWTVVAVFRPATSGAIMASIGSESGAAAGPCYYGTAADYFLIYSSTTLNFGSGDTAFHVLSGNTVPAFYVDGVSRTGSTSGAAAPGDFESIGGSSALPFSSGDLAEVLVYNSVLGTTDRTNLEGYLRTKYGTP